MVIEVCKSERRTRTWRVVIEGETTFGLSSDVKIRAKYDVRVFVECQNTGRIRRSDFFRMSDYGRIRRSDFRRTSTYGQNTAFGFMSDSQNTDLIRRSDTRRIQNTMPEDAEQEARHRSSVPQPATAALECPPPWAFLTQNEGSTPTPLLLRRRHRNGNTRPSFVELPPKTPIFLQLHEETQQRVSLGRRGAAGPSGRGQPNYLFSNAPCLNQ